MLLNNLFETEYFTLNFVASSASFTMAPHLLHYWLGSLYCCSFGAACVMAHSTYASQWLVHRWFLILNWDSWLRDVRVTRLSWFRLVIIRFSLTAVNWMLVRPRLYYLFTAVNPYAPIRSARFFQIVNFFRYVRLVDRHKRVCAGFLRRWHVWSLWWMNWVCRFRPLGENRFGPSLLHDDLLQFLVFRSQ